MCQATYIFFSHYFMYSLSANLRKASRKSKLVFNVVCNGSPSRIRMVRRISLGITTRPGHRCAARSQLLSSIYILQLLSFVTGDGGCACPSSSAVCLFSAMAAKICSRRCWGFLENAGTTGSCAGWRDVLYPLIKETQM